MDSNQKEALDELVTSDGWRLFVAFVDAEWGAGGRAFESAAVAAANDTGNPHSIAHLQQIIAARREIQKILKWPDEQLKTLKEPELVAATTDYSRRGSL